jgi:hypothetical protein
VKNDLQSLTLTFGRKIPGDGNWSLTFNVEIAEECSSFGGAIRVDIYPATAPHFYANIFAVPKPLEGAHS